MTRLAACALLLCTTYYCPAIEPKSAVEPNPAKLRPTADQLAKAEEAARKLGSGSYQEREKASRELAEMGRVALGVIDRTLAETSSAEVRARCESLRPPMLQADLRARLDAFLADADGKYDHKLPGWQEFQKQVGNTAVARKLFGEMNENASTSRLLALLNGPKEVLARAVSDRRTEIYNRMYGRARVIAINGVMQQERVQPQAVEVAGLLFLEAVAGPTADKRTVYSLNSIVLSNPARETIADAEKGEPYRRLVRFWSDTRTDPAEIYQAMTLATTLNIKDIPATKYALKLLEAKGVTAQQQAYAITALARSGGKDQMENLRKQFDNKTVLQTFFFAANGQAERVEMQVRDVALAMAIVVTEQKAEDYGYEVRLPNKSVEYSYNYYRLTDDEKRKAAFKKWGEWEAKQKK